ncbi:MAG: hypothetical protein RRY25_02830 [Anaerovorax sp.]
MTMRKRSFLILMTMLITVVVVFLGFYFSANRTAVYQDGKLFFKDAVYIPISGKYHESKTIGKTADKNWEVNAIEDDPSHCFVAARSFSDQILFVKEDYQVPQHGKLTGVYVDNLNIIETDRFCEAITAILNQSKGEKFNFETDNIHNYAKEIYLCYENCPVGTVWGGFIGIVNNRWVYIEPFDTSRLSEDGSPKKITISCRVIDQPYIKTIKLLEY